MNEHVRCKWCRVPLVLILSPDRKPEFNADGQLIVHALCPACDFVPTGGPPTTVRTQP